jgi:hypothetical protein
MHKNPYHYMISFRGQLLILFRMVLQNLLLDELLILQGKIYTIAAIF